MLFLIPLCAIFLLFFLFSDLQPAPFIRRALRSLTFMYWSCCFVCAPLTVAACSPPGSPVCQRWPLQNRLWEQPVSLPLSPAPHPEGQPSIQRSPFPCTHTNAQPNTHLHEKPTTLTPSPNNPRKQFHLDSGGGPLSPAPSIFPY